MYEESRGVTCNNRLDLVFLKKVCSLGLTE